MKYDKRCGKNERHTPHWWPEDNPARHKYWCDGKPDNSALVKD